jgi:4-aminobutyrate aminotransferase/(S)-3-amino-2-methylpropionate transaminase
MDGTSLPRLRTAVPGPASIAKIDVLARRECPAITARRARTAESLGLATADPIVWDEAIGANVIDVDGNVFVDFTSGFGVALVGHRHPSVVAAATAQAGRLLHAMGDAFPDATRVELLDRLVSVAPPGLERAILGLSGADAIDAAVKTAVLATGRPGVLAFKGGYHGLSLATVPLQGYKDSFSAPFRAITNPRVVHLPYGCPLEHVQHALAAGDLGLVLVEPLQGRGGIRVPPPGWIRELGDLARATGALVAHDEIQCGLGRTGRRWAADVAPDLLCVGKALGGGYPISACLGARDAMAAWGASKGEALHTQTFLGHPIGNATALAVLDLLPELPARCAERGARLRAAVEARGFTTQGAGLMLGVRVDASVAVSRALLERGFLVLPAGMSAEVLALTPPVSLTNDQIDAFASALAEVA